MCAMDKLLTIVLVLCFACCVFGLENIEEKNNDSDTLINGMW